MADNDTRTSTRYGKSSAGGGSQDQGERKDEGWTSRQGGPQSASHPGREPSADDNPTRGARSDLADRPIDDEDAPAAGTDQPPRMGGPLGPDPKNPHLPEGAQNSDTQGTGAGGFDRGVNATQIGAVHQGARPEESRNAG